MLFIKRIGAKFLPEYAWIKGYNPLTGSYLVLYANGIAFIITAINLVIGSYAESGWAILVNIIWLWMVGWGYFYGRSEIKLIRASDRYKQYVVKRDIYNALFKKGGVPKLDNLDSFYQGFVLGVINSCLTYKDNKNFGSGAYMRLVLNTDQYKERNNGY